ncbi:MAG TPA: cytochrome C, partial [Chitinophagales bacterium]
MKKVVKITGVAVGILFVLIALLLTYVKTMLPNVGEVPNITVEKTSEQIARGKYLANYVMVCMDCHSARDYTLFSGPMVAGTNGKGGEVFDQKLSFPGKFVASNLTPFHLVDWTDGEIFRAITTGVSKDGSALFPTMPYHNYG